MNTEYPIATAPKRTTTTWTNTYTTKQHLTEKAHNPTIIPTTTHQYHTAPKNRQAELKDVGGFVAGHLKNGRRKKGNVLNRSLITLDLDTIPTGTNLPQTLKNTLTCAWLAHTTLSHTEENPRWRIWIWLTTPVTPDHYQPIARRIAWDINPGLEWFDQTTFQPERFFYWPATTTDGNYHIEESTNQPDLNPTDVLNRYTDPNDVTTWPGVDQETINLHNRTTMVAAATGTAHNNSGGSASNSSSGVVSTDPRTKPGLLGAFNRAHTITNTINTFLTDIYTPGTTPGRYTYTKGTSTNGLIIYDGDLHAYSQHATDPASGQNLTAFDLVRIHTYGHLDTTTTDTTPINKRPSYTAMMDFAAHDPDTRRENAKDITELFQPITTTAGEQNTTNAAATNTTGDPHDWLTTLETTKTGQFTDTITNFETIFHNDPHLKHIAWNEHTHQLQPTDPQTLPWTPLTQGWTENDEAQLKTHIARTYHGLYAPQKMHDALLAEATRKKFHPVRDYFTTLPPWDGTPRLGTLLIDYLGANNTDYTRAVTRKTLVAAHRRTFNPGTKFDTVLTLVGPQGIGKSTIFNKLAGQWFSDNLTITDMKDKTGAEKLTGNLIVELAELAGMRKAESESVKAFISRTEDKYRPAYGRNVETYPRECIIVGSTNSEEGFLRDPTGNRRWWPVTVNGDDARFSVQDLVAEVVDQIWAEARYLDQQGEELYLTGELADEAVKAQTRMVEADDRIGLVENYLAKPLPKNWDQIPLGARRIYLDGGDLPFASYAEGFVQREMVSKIEIWAECFGRDPDSMRRMDSFEITSILQRIPGWEDQGKHKRLAWYGKQRIFERTDVLTEKAE